MNTDILKMTSSSASNSDVVTVTNKGDIVQYKSDDYVNKVFNYFVLELIKDDNDETGVLSESDMFNLINNKKEINGSNIDIQPKCIRNLYEDVMKLKNNYLFAYYLSRLYENRLYDNRMNSALKYYDFSEYIIGLNVDFETLDWSTLKKVKTNRELYNIYGEKMHRITNEFLNKGYIKEITDIEDIDEVLKLYKLNAQTKAYNSKIYKLLSLQDEFKNLDLLDDKKNDEINEYDEINEWYYGKNDNNKRKFEELVLNIIKKYEKNKRIKLIDEEIKKKNEREILINNNIYKIFNFSIIYCFISYIFIFYSKLTVTNTNNKINTVDIITNNLSDVSIIDNICTDTEKN